MDTNLTKSTTTKGYTNGKIKMMRFIGMLLIAVILLTFPVFASANIGENGGKWVLKQIFYVALVIIVVVVSKHFFSGNLVKMGISGVVAALLLVIIDDPQKLKTLGDAVWTTFSTGA